ncbi:DUF3955 domain-containing protein [Bacillus pseudomycoides]|uniref:DUF3955 domain-containing protein n=1 Tax=Bacillus pseudomycoides TaxID=64104 RepID=UPI000BF15628|nr:DUF3955 domain-containing protein [Bacillus pseudomycoides]PEI90056.1 hypothetical protein CN686_24915 [Bacillus pseudomycoides]PEM62399.1 hypothetical protein CN619_29560 [Bacillus pseudomycoides]PHA39377.1 hypothetical protein COE73_29060 [Bacillus pseudomycoides]PHA51417.1 hypothetical protein COE76_24620 [Bacillus pseudomycoides]
MNKHILSLIPFILGICCLLTYNVRSIETAVAADGTLVEPFYLLPIGYLFLAISVISLFVNLLTLIKKVNK